MPDLSPPSYSHIAYAYGYRTAHASAIRRTTMDLPARTPATSTCAPAARIQRSSGCRVYARHATCCFNTQTRSVDATITSPLPPLRCYAVGSPFNFLLRFVSVPARVSHYDRCVPVTTCHACTATDVPPTHLIPPDPVQRRRAPLRQTASLTYCHDIYGLITINHIPGLPVFCLFGW